MRRWIVIGILVVGAILLTKFMPHLNLAGNGFVSGAVSSVGK